MLAFRRFHAGLLVLATLACASPGGGSGGGASTSADTPGSRRSSDVITQAEIQDVAIGSTYEVVQRLRPAWLRTRGSGTPNSPPQYAIVYVDGARVGGLEALRGINAADVFAIRYLRGPDATTRFGTGHEGGAIVVETKK